MADIVIGQPSGRLVDGAAHVQPTPRLNWGKVVAVAFSIAMIGAMLSAAPKNWQTRPQDSFPFSYFPMFSFEHADLNTEDYIAGWDADGNRYAIPFNSIAPGGHIVRIRRETVIKMVRSGRSAQLCQDVSRRIAERNAPSLRSLVSLEVVSGTFSLSQYLQGNRAPVSETVRATCAIRR